MKMPINKYKDFIIYEIENGWILKTVPRDDPSEPNQIEFISTYCKTTEDLFKLLEVEME